MEQETITYTKIIDLNVGGIVYTTTLATLTKYPSSMLAKMFSGRIPTDKDQHGRYFIGIWI
jgi:hypothetical protein